MPPQPRHTRGQARYQRARRTTARDAGVVHADGEELVFTTWGDSVKGRTSAEIRARRCSWTRKSAPYIFVHIRAHVTLSAHLEELLRFATAIGGRYMGGDRAGEFGHRNAVPGELLVRLRPERVIAAADVAG